MRQYEPVWLEIKNKGYARVAAPVQLHRRIIKAVTKEKHKDVGYKLQLMADNTVAELSYAIEGKIISFRLKKMFKLLNEVSLADL